MSTAKKQKLTHEDLFDFVTRKSWITQTRYATAIGYSDGSKISTYKNKRINKGLPFPRETIEKISANSMELAIQLCRGYENKSKSTFEYEFPFLQAKIKLLQSSYELPNGQDAKLTQKMDDVEANQSTATREIEELLHGLILSLESKATPVASQIGGIIATTDEYDKNIRECRTRLTELYDRHTNDNVCYLSNQRNEIIKISEDSTRILREVNFTERLSKKAGVPFTYEIERHFDRTEFNQTDDEFSKQKYGGLTVKINGQSLDEYYKDSGLSPTSMIPKKKVAEVSGAITDWEIISRYPIKNDETDFYIEASYTSEAQFEIERNNYIYRLKFPCKSIEHSFTLDGNIKNMCEILVRPLLPFYSVKGNKEPNPVSSNRDKSNVTYRISGWNITGTGYVRSIRLRELLLPMDKDLQTFCHKKVVKK